MEKDPDDPLFESARRALCANMIRHRLLRAPHEETRCACIHHCPGDADTGSAAQGAALTAAGAVNVYREVASGAKTDRA